jgi:hypothetical protein
MIISYTATDVRYSLYECNIIAMFLPAAANKHTRYDAQHLSKLQAQLLLQVGPPPVGGTSRRRSRSARHLIEFRKRRPAPKAVPRHLRQALIGLPPTTLAFILLTGPHARRRLRCASERTHDLNVGCPVWYLSFGCQTSEIGFAGACPWNDRVNKGLSLSAICCRFGA